MESKIEATQSASVAYKLKDSSAKGNILTHRLDREMEVACCDYTGTSFIRECHRSVFTTELRRSYRKSGCKFLASSYATSKILMRNKILEPSVDLVKQRCCLEPTRFYCSNPKAIWNCTQVFLCALNSIRCGEQGDLMDFVKLKIWLREKDSSFEGPGEEGLLDDLKLIVYVELFAKKEDDLWWN